MKNSTLDRPTISKERIAALEELLSDKTTTYDTTPGVYTRSDKDRELDILWQGFKINGKDERSPGVYLTIGFITGAICMFLTSAILNFGNPSKDNFADLNLWKKGNTEIKEKTTTTPLTITPPNQTATSGKTESYTIQSGDTLEKVAIKYYGTSDPGKIEQIQTANNMDDPNKLQIGQKILVPLEN